MTTVAEAIEKVALNMSLVTGQNMNPYSEDQIAQYLSNAHDMLTSKYSWPELTNTFTKVLDGTTGKITVAFTTADGITDYKQIKKVYSASVMRELPIITGYVNPLISYPIIGYTPLSITEDPNKTYLIKVYPITTTGNVAIVASVKADFTDLDTVVPIDDLLHIWVATWMWAEDDGTNPGQAEKFKLLWEDRVKDIRSNVNQGPFSLSASNGQLQDWWESPF